MATLDLPRTGAAKGAVVAHLPVTRRPAHGIEASVDAELFPDSDYTTWTAAQTPSTAAGPFGLVIVSEQEQTARPSLTPMKRWLLHWCRPTLRT